MWKLDAKIVKDERAFLHEELKEEEDICTKNPHEHEIRWWSHVVVTRITNTGSNSDVVDFGKIMQGI